MVLYSERAMAFNIAEQLSKKDILVHTQTTDRDTKAHLGMSHFYDQLGNAWSVARIADPYHLGTRQVRKTRQSNWNQTLFEGKKLSYGGRQQVTAALIEVLCHY